MDLFFHVFSTASNLSNCPPCLSASGLFQGLWSTVLSTLLLDCNVVGCQGALPEAEGRLPEAGGEVDRPSGWRSELCWFRQGLRSVTV